MSYTKLYSQPLSERASNRLSRPDLYVIHDTSYYHSIAGLSPAFIQSSLDLVSEMVVITSKLPLAGLVNATSAPTKALSASVNNALRIDGAYQIDLAWLTNAITAGPTLCTKKGLVSYITGLSLLLSKQQFAFVDLILRSIRPAKLSPEILVATVRTSFAARHKLRAWKHAVSSIRKELEVRGLNAGELLQGLG